MFSWLKSAPETPRNVSVEEVTLASLDARMKRIEIMLSVPCPARQRVDLSCQRGTLEGSLASLGRAIKAEAQKRGEA